MLPGIMLAVALTTDPTVVSAWPVSALDAELAIAEAGYRDIIQDRIKACEYWEGQKVMYEKRLAENGGSTDRERKQVAIFARRLDESGTELNEANDQLKAVLHRRSEERKLRAKGPKEKR